MSRRNAFWALLLFAIGLSWPGVAMGAAIDDVAITVTFADEPGDGTYPARLDMRISYTGDPGERISTFRTFESAFLYDIQIESEDLRSINHSYEEGSQANTLEWSGFLDDDGTADVQVQATMHHLLIGRETLNVMNLDWTGGWSLQVDQYRLDILFPPGFAPRKLSGKDDFADLEIFLDDQERMVASKYIRYLVPRQALEGRLVVEPGLITDLGALRYDPREIAIFLGIMTLIFIGPGAYVFLRVYRAVSSTTTTSGGRQEVNLLLGAMKPPERPKPDDDQDEPSKPDGE